MAARVVFPDGGTWATVYDWCLAVAEACMAVAGWRNASRKGDTASQSPRFAGDSPGDGATSSARTEVWWTMEGVR